MTLPDTPDQVALAVRQAIRAHTMGSTRSQQSAAKLIGISEIGGCRAYLARMILQLPFDEMDDIKWAAFCGTALGERLEMAVRETVPGVFTQVPLTATLPSGLKISGSADIVKAGQGIWDFKSVNGLEMIRRNGPSFQQQAQANTYLLAAIQAGLVPEDGCWYLVYVDRSGADDMPHVVAHTYDPDVTAIVSQRLEDVMYAVLRDLDSAQRDMPHDWCMKVCPFYSNCRGRDEHQVQGLIEAEEHRQAVKDYQEGKRLEKAGKALADEAKEMLLGVSGSTGETEVSWTVVPETTIPTYERSAYTRMTLRKVTKPTRPDC